jgi:hypothetical protein
MPERSNAPLQNITGQAEREMTAFLHATAEVFGRDGAPPAGEAWLRTMESLDWPCENHEKFFRRVSILAISQLTGETHRFSGPQTPLVLAFERIVQGYSYAAGQAES